MTHFRNACPALQRIVEAQLFGKDGSNIPKRFMLDKSTTVLAIAAVIYQGCTLSRLRCAEARYSRNLRVFKIDPLPKLTVDRIERAAKMICLAMTPDDLLMRR